MAWPLLDALQTPADLRRLGPAELRALCAELRERINGVVRETGGHLGPNLGAVELIVAAHLVFDLDKDRLVFDVGHQAYAHKLLTGRHRSFDTLRQSGGVSGYPHPGESPFDVFRSGHASTAISTAAGLLEAFASKPETRDRKVLALVGDGSLTGGMAFEGLNHAGHLKKNLIVLLNDNRMSISPTVGALSAYFNRLRNLPQARTIQQDVRRFIERIPRIGGELSEAAGVLRRQGIHLMNPGQFFIDLGFEYLGPVEGHQLERLVEALRLARATEGPVLIHILTEKGKGYKPHPKGEESYGPHALSPGQRVKEEAAASGVVAPAAAPAPLSWSKAFARTLANAARRDPRVCALTAAMEEGTALEGFHKEFPERYYDVGICEQHAVGFAAGLAAAGMRPVFAVYSTFLQRAFDQIFHDVALQGRLPVIFCIDRGGLVGDDGPSHHGVYDIAYLRLFPNLLVLAPKDEEELEAMMAFALAQDYPCAIRYPRDSVPAAGTFPPPEPVELGRMETLRRGREVCLIAYGAVAATALRAAERLAPEGIDLTVVNARFVRPLDLQGLAELSKGHRAILTLEEGALPGGFGSAVAEGLADLQLMPSRFRRLGIPDRFIEHAPRADQLAECGLDIDGVARAVRELLRS
ncbi:MAG: 1-deoxy-D-xylulose-5-phosphate synthase [Spirochaetes bacterium]|nr:1-deoxy-D-xylulose-5-phosphate synthase [Spirochaetota bacterium]